MRPAAFLRVLSGEIVFFRRNSQHYRESDVPDRQSDVFYRQSSGPRRTPPENDNTIEDSAI